MEIRINIKDVSEALAHAGDEDQANIINEFGRLLRMACKGDAMAIEKQLCYVAERLNPHGCELISALEAFIKLKQ